jgi:hypothetical protein
MSDLELRARSRALSTLTASVRIFAAFEAPQEILADWFTSLEEKRTRDDWPTVVAHARTWTKAD